ncbi:MAG TPA: hypothetical protein VGK30_08465 [Candidatus Binatia bacterium]
MRRSFILGIVGSAALAAVAMTSAGAETVEEHHSSYDSKTVESAPVVREHTTVETVPAPQVQKRTSETIVKDGKDHDSDTKIETKSKTKVEHDDD